MDAERNGEYSRAPEVEDVVALCKSLNEHGVRYVLIGGFAINFHGLTRATKDVDLLVDPSPENVKKIKQAMSVLPDNAIREMGENEVEQYTVVRIADEYVVDLLAKACGVNYKEASKEIEYITIEGVRIPVAGKKTLIKTKDTIRPGDRMDVDFLKAEIEAERKK